MKDIYKITSDPICNPRAIIQGSLLALDLPQALFCALGEFLTTQFFDQK